MKRNKFLKIDPSMVAGDFRFKVDTKSSIKKPDTPTEVESVGDGWVFPETITIYNDRDEYLYAFGSTHTWRTSDLKEWELVN